MNIHVGDRKYEFKQKKVVSRKTLLRNGEAEAFLFMPHLP